MNEEKYIEYYVEYDTMYMPCRISYKTYTEALNFVKYMLQRNKYEYTKYLNIRFYKLEKTMFDVSYYAKEIESGENRISE